MLADHRKIDHESIQTLHRTTDINHVHHHHIKKCYLRQQRELEELSLFILNRALIDENHQPHS